MARMNMAGVKTVRHLALGAGAAWFIYWGHLAYVNCLLRDKAESALFEADARRDWAASWMHEQERRDASRNLVRAIGWGFALPLTLLVLGEFAWSIRSMTRPKR